MPLSADGMKRVRFRRSSISQSLSRLPSRRLSSIVAVSALVLLAATLGNLFAGPAPASAQSEGICDRTEQVQTAILAWEFSDSWGSVIWSLDLSVRASCCYSSGGA